ncbi:glycosyltransferase involved in cell wall biosynthesis [Rhodoblastus acidophilus]|uniref:glycosyltransferase n=1 Tax=Rhodoblastus acidophilus TaxID=1074 RepID=UPI00222436D9|nr:glycosyltransferase [Rhodoblastus acidophilus]MCW2317308.1 glycosyltransferase involved in cell wall biosynthesis [Rhodoblastus acidophilus]
MGFGHLQRFGHAVTFSPGRRRSLFERLVRKLVGFDAIHGLINRRAIGQADVVLTHTEEEYLAAALAARLFRLNKPIIVGNTLWLFHQWPRLPFWRRWLARRLIERVDLLTCNALPNVAAAAALGLAPVRYVPYGISLDSFAPVEPTLRAGDMIAAIGNDQARDWKAVREVALQNPDLRLRVASRFAHSNLAGLPHVEIRPTHGVAETNAVYDAARMTLVCVKDNRHASGITVLLEAVARGAPVVCADQGGLGDYFSGDELWFYGPGRDHATAAQAARAATRAAPAKAAGDGA